MVKAACQRILRDPTLAEDAAQEVFLLLVRKLPLLPPQTILGGWLYVTACHLASTHRRTNARRWQRENQPEVMNNLMNPAQDTLWRELEPLLDDAMLTLSDRQRELVLSHYFQNNSQRAAAGVLGCSESAASRELAAAIESLRRFLSRHGVTMSGAALITLLTTHGAQASIGTAGVAATLSAASALAGTSAAGTSLLLALMKTTTSKIMLGAAALLVTSGTVFYFTLKDFQTPEPKVGEQPALARIKAERSQSTQDISGTPPMPAVLSPRKSHLLPPAVSAKTRTYDQVALKAAVEKYQRFVERLRGLALMGDSLKVQGILSGEYGIHFSLDEIRKLQRGGEKEFIFGIGQLWASKQPQEALAWAASVSSGSIGPGADPHQF